MQNITRRNSVLIIGLAVCLGFSTHVYAGCTLTGSISSYSYCASDNSGYAIATVSGGTAPYKYSWSPSGGTGDTAQHIAPGKYIVTITDFSGCMVKDSIVIKKAVLASVIVLDTASCTGSGGTLLACVSGGTAPFNFSWSDGEIRQIISGRDDGTYTVSVTDSNGCVDTASGRVTGPPQMYVNVTTSATPTCWSQINGFVKANVSGGTPPYQYLWAPVGATTDSMGGLPGGTYSVYVTDKNGCTNSFSATLGSSDDLTTSAIYSATPTTCSGSTGAATGEDISGGTPPFTYSWNSGQTTSTINGLSIGTYTFTVTDSYGCHSSSIAIISGTNGPKVTIASFKNASCNSYTDGSITVSATGGTPPYKYQWYPSGGTTQTATGLSAGTYSCEVIDATGCIGYDTLTIVKHPPILAAEVSIYQNNLCYNGNNGSASIYFSGGTAPFTYLWSPSGSTNSYASNLSVGTYTATVTDANGCTASSSTVITQLPPITVTTSVIAASCSKKNGVGWVIPLGGLCPCYTYSWAPYGGNNDTATALLAGTYTCTIGNVGCSISVNVIVPDSAGPILTSNSIPVNSSCNGSAWVMASGGKSPYTYSWGSGQTTDTIKGQCAGTYCCNVTDANGCTNSICVTVNNVTGIQQVNSSSILRVYPIPATNTLTVDMTGLGYPPTYLAVFDITGRKISEEKASPNTSTLNIDVSKLVAGIYLLKVSGITTEKIERFTVVR